MPNLFSCEASSSRSLRMSSQLSASALRFFWVRGESWETHQVCWASVWKSVRHDVAESRGLIADSYELSVILPRGFHPFPSRTRKLSPAGPIVLHAKVCGRVGSCRHK